MKRLCTALILNAAMLGCHAATVDSDVRQFMESSDPGRTLSIIATFEEALTERQLQLLQAIGIAGFHVAEYPLAAIEVNPSQLRSVAQMRGLKAVAAVRQRHHRAAEISRLDLVLSLIRVMGHERRAHEMNVRDIMVGAERLVDSEHIPEAFRGHVQLALDLGLIQPRSGRFAEIAPGVYRKLAGPRFEPDSPVSGASPIVPSRRLAGRMRL